MGESLQEPWALPLGHTADHANNDLSSFLLFNAVDAQTAPHLVFGLFSNRTRVVDHHIRLGAVIGEDISQRAQLAANQLAIQFIHLTTKGFKMDAASGHRW